ncbi:MAG: hypothetical protein EXS38_11395, partial [Opitutus sp.]|nr:hypothetical protein [Opitutus sp.]
MKPAPFPSTPRLGLGCVTFGREIDAETSFTLMDHAYSHGITLFDTAAAYAGGASEIIIGRWLIHGKSVRRGNVMKSAEVDSRLSPIAATVRRRRTWRAPAFARSSPTRNPP